MGKHYVSRKSGNEFWKYNDEVPSHSEYEYVRMLMSEN